MTSAILPPLKRWGQALVLIDNMAQFCIPKLYPLIHVTANLFLENFGPTFTNMPEGHIETDIAGASSLAGLMLLRATVKDLDKYEPGTVILSEVHAAQDELFAFIRNVAASIGLDYEKGWTTPIPDEHQPLFSTLEMTRRLEQPLYSSCLETALLRDYYPHAAALAAMKLVAAGEQMHRLAQNIGKGLVSYYVVAGSKTVPYPLPISD